jgi:hypothetical protein
MECPTMDDKITQESRFMEMMHEMNARVVRIESGLDSLNQRLEEVVISQLKDHGKRLAVLEEERAIRAGERSMLFFFGTLLGSVVSVVATTFVKMIM